MQNGKTVTTGLVLRVTETKEADKILTVLTPDMGKIPLIARGARRKNSRIAAASQLLAYSELTLYKRGNWHMLDEASTLELFDGVRQDIVLLSLASYFAEAAEAVCAEEKTSPEILSLLLNGLYALCYLHKEPRLVKAAFQFRLGCKRLGGLSMPLTAAGLAALRHVLYCDSRRLYGFTLEPEALRELDHAGEAFIAGQLERSFRTLDYYKSLLI